MPTARTDGARWGLLLVLGGGAVGCFARDGGGQEGEEYDPEAGSTDNGSDGSDGSDGADGGGADGGEDVDDGAFEAWEGRLSHVRGGGYTAGTIECALEWSTVGERIDSSGCPDCAFVFEVVETLDAAASEGEGRCADEAVDHVRKLGYAADYMGYGPALVAVDEGYWGSYMLGFAQLEDGELSWSYGYIDYAFTYSDRIYYSTWFWEGEALLSD